ncbi:unnamed protein product [Darwinula stevensoni]|uniref:2',3'-cyclic-nucleotide 3'-phosphodiesterase n=1 Tax=Darwinula stevensoni TaxID=69355 RepID=A0A7R8X6V3_9CRUS|nr:unnamed protein product [Darwinula stevensoni]CAG0881872.1 unnamed protein product [Darwinula stevensoni]
MGAKVSRVTPERTSVDQGHLIEASPNVPSSKVALPENQAQTLPLPADLTLDFPFFKDPLTVEYFQDSKVILIMRGLPGSGKSHLTKVITQLYPHATICSADDYYSLTGMYEFDPSRLKDAHAYSQAKADQECNKGTSVVIIDNTNVTRWEMIPYVKMGNAYKYVVLLIEPKTPWFKDAEELARRNTHNVSVDLLKRRLHAWQKMSPLYYGWFLNEADTWLLKRVGDAWLERCLEVSDFLEDFMGWSGLECPEDMMKYYQRMEPELLHCTAMFSGRGKVPGSREYERKSEVENALGQAFHLHMIGFFITSRSFGIRVKLTEDQLNVWAQNDFEEEIPALPTRSKHTRRNSDQNPVVLEPRASLISVQQSQEVMAHRMRPLKSEGRRAHITLAFKPGERPMCTGFDAMKVAEFEGRDSQTDLCKVYQVPGGILCSYGKGIWVIYPEIQYVAISLFAGFY